MDGQAQGECRCGGGRDTPPVAANAGRRRAGDRELSDARCRCREATCELEMAVQQQVNDEPVLQSNVAPVLCLSAARMANLVFLPLQIFRQPARCLQSIRGARNAQGRTGGGIPCNLGVPLTRRGQGRHSTTVSIHEKDAMSGKVRRQLALGGPCCHRGMAGLPARHTAGASVACVCSCSVLGEWSAGVQSRRGGFPPPAAAAATSCLLVAALTPACPRLPNLQPGKSLTVGQYSEAVLSK